MFPQNVICSRPITGSIIEREPERREQRRRLNSIEEGDPILVQTPSGICEQGVFVRTEDNFLIWARTIAGSSFITITSLDAISITRL